MTTISAAIITLNEEEDIEDCLRSIQWVDEIILVDSFSTDRTIEIAGKFTDRIFQRQWPGFTPQKNFAISQATGDWILSIDADERVTDELRDEILEVISQPNTCDGYYIARRNYWLGKWIKYGGWYPDYTLRLFKRGKGEYKYKVHERVEVNSSVGKVKNDLIHYNLKSVDDHLKTLMRATSAEAVEAIENGVKFYWFIPFRPLFTFCREYLKSPKNSFSMRLLGKRIFKNKIEIIWLIPLKPFWKFFTMYFIRLGFLDGLHGFWVAVLSSVYTAVRYAKLWEALRQEKQDAHCH